MAVEAEAAPQPRDYAADFREGASLEATQFESSRQQLATEPASTLFQENSDEQHRDLDVPAFLRRIQF